MRKPTHNNKPAQSAQQLNRTYSTNEFTAYCNYYYNLTIKLAKQQERFKTMLEDAPVWRGQYRLSEVDAIINYYRRTQGEQAKVDAVLDDMRETERTILMIMRHFEIPPGYVLVGEIPGSLEYEIWADDTDAIHIRKTFDLAPLQLPDNIIEIKVSGWEDEEE